MAGKTIHTYIFYDIEATGLTGPGLVPRITEISFVAVSSLSLSGSDTTTDGLPRVLNKLTLCVCPRKTVPAFISDMTGLHNDVLQHQTDFSADTANMINLFIEQHERPICLVAHNGTNYDFGLLRAEYDSVGKSFPPDLLCVDSLTMFKDIDMNQDANMPNHQQGVYSEPMQQKTPIKLEGSPDEGQKSQAVKRKLFPDNGSGETVSGDKNVGESKKVLISLENDSNITLESTQILVKAVGTDIVREKASAEITNRNPPNFWEKLKTGDSLEDNILSNIALPEAPLVNTNDHDECQLDLEKKIPFGTVSAKEGVLPNDQMTVHKELLPEKSTISSSNVASTASISAQNPGIQTKADNRPTFCASMAVTLPAALPTPPKTPSKQARLSYKLKELHKRVVGHYPFDGHRAEDDTLAIVRIFHKVPTKVCSWAENNAISFGNIPPAYENQRRSPLPEGVFPYSYTGKH